MTDAFILDILKIDLGISVPAYDALLTQNIKAARSFIETEGIALTDSEDDSMLVEMYAAYLYRVRHNEKDNTGLMSKMPRYLRWALNNRLLSQKGGSQ